MYTTLLKELRQILDPAAILRDADMSLYTSFKAGGQADILLQISEKETLRQVVALLKTHRLPYMTIGNGTNILVKDTGYCGVLIRFVDNTGMPVLADTAITARAGIPLSTLSLFAAQSSLSGLEFLSGIPGSVGGAVCMNAGAYGGEIKDVLSHVEVLQEDGCVKTLPTHQLDFAYRTSCFQTNSAIILSATFQTAFASSQSIYEKMSSINGRRREKQPLEHPSAGSTFKRPTGYFAGSLIEQCGLKGKGVGGAKVSEKHAGFIINYNHASAQDILDTMDMVRDTVFQTFAILLEPEIKILG